MYNKNNKNINEQSLEKQNDLYALLPTSDDPVMNNGSIEANTLMDMLNTNNLLQQQQMEHPLSIGNSLPSTSSLPSTNSFPTPSSSLSTSNDLYLQQQDLINFELPQQPNTIESLDTYRTNQRRHSVSVDFFSAFSDNRTSMTDIFTQNPIEFSPLPWSISEDARPIRHKRFLSQQFDSLQENECPLPMSGIPSRRMSIATASDISTWNKRKRVERQETVAEEQDVSDYPKLTEADMRDVQSNPDAIPRRQKPRYEGDEYTPKWVRYIGQLKEGYCDTCEQGKWLQLKNSAYWYHKQFYHGISSISGHHFLDPIEYRENDVLEGLCHQCNKYVPISNAKRKNSVLWYRHAHKCHAYDKPKTKISASKRGSVND